MEDTVAENGKVTGSDLDRRVRERLLASGILKPEAVEAYLAGLPDLETQSEVMAIEQPALGAAPYGQRVEAAIDDEGVE